MNYELNQIVKGKNAGTFVIVGFRTVGSEEGVQVKAVNPANHAEVAPGEMFLPMDAIKPIN